MHAHKLSLFLSTLENHSPYMQRCLQLALLGAGHVAPNPMVGALLVYQDTIIGEGYHQQYGAAHAEVNCFNSVDAAHLHLIPESTLYVSLEPCAHFGKTPPCADLIIRHRVPQVVVGCSDPFASVAGRGIAKLKAAGIVVIENVLRQEALDVNKRFFTFHTKKRPWILLKWAQTKDGYMAGSDNKRLMISNAHTNRFTHQFRASEAAILVGFNTALKDNPELTSRFGYHPHPTRIVIDPHLQIPHNAAIFNNTAPVIVINELEEKVTQHIHFAQYEKGGDVLPFLMNLLYQKQLLSLMVEGGAYTLQTFIDAGLWDEALMITNTSMVQLNGILAPQLPTSSQIVEKEIETDLIRMYKNEHL
jgi:diaminohydroxyphosphoribosylaminopyrimidine deaminase/5-amino-6-(5-phosphoribosylamino)uracil reductase